MKLQIGSTTIAAPIEDILHELKKSLSPRLFKNIQNRGRNLQITCPFHKNGDENRPSCQILQVQDDPHTQYGMVHCFTCGYAATLPQMIADLYGQPLKFGEDWLVSRFGGSTFYLNQDFWLPEINLNQTVGQKQLPETVLNQYNYYHPYMEQRKLTREVIEKFKIGYDRDLDAITFPVWDENGNLVTITKRSVHTKQFYIETGIEKPVYLLNFIKKEHIETVLITEGQIDALTAWSYGSPCIATLGSPSKEQLKILNRSGIRCYITAFDNDRAGQHFTQVLRQGLSPDVLVSTLVFPEGRKDLNDLSKEEFQQCMQQLRSDFI